MNARGPESGEASKWMEPYRRFYRIAGIAVAGFLGFVAILALLGAVGPGIVPIATWSFVVGATLLGLYIAVPIVLWVLAAMTRRLRSDGRTIAQLQEQQTQAQARNEEVQQALGELESGLTAERKALDAARRELEGAMNKARHDQDAVWQGQLSEAMHDVAGRLERNHAAARSVRDAVKDQVRTLEEAVRQQGDLLRSTQDTLAAQAVTSDDAIEQLASRIEALEDGQRRTDAAAGDVRSRLNDAWRMVQRHGDRLDAHDARLDQLEANVLAAHAQARAAYRTASQALDGVMLQADRLRATKKAVEDELAATGRRAADDLAATRAAIEKQTARAKQHAQRASSKISKEEQARREEVAQLGNDLARIADRLESMHRAQGALNEALGAHADHTRRKSKQQDAKALSWAKNLAEAIRELREQHDRLAADMAALPDAQARALRRTRRRMGRALRDTNQELRKFTDALQHEQGANGEAMRDELQDARGAIAQAQDALEDRLSADLQDVKDGAVARQEALQSHMEEALSKMRGVQKAAAKELHAALAEHSDEAQAREQALKANLSELQDAVSAARKADAARVEQALDAVEQQQQANAKKLRSAMRKHHKEADQALEEAVAVLASGTGDALVDAVEQLGNAWDEKARRATAKGRPIRPDASSHPRYREASSEQGTNVARAHTGARSGASAADAAKHPSDAPLSKADEAALRRVKAAAKAAMDKPSEATRARFDDAVAKMQERSQKAVRDVVRKAHKDQLRRAGALARSLEVQAHTAQQDLQDAVAELTQQMEAEDAKLGTDIAAAGRTAHNKVQAAVRDFTNRMAEAHEREADMADAQQETREALNAFVHRMEDAPATPKQRAEMGRIATAYIEKRLRDLLQRQEAALLAYTDGLEGEYDAFLASPPEVRDDGERAIPVKADRIYHASPFGHVAPIRDVVVNAEFRTRLRKEGVQDTQQLWELPAQRVARMAGVPIGIARAWQAAAALNAIDGIGPSAAQLLAAVGIQSVEELSQQDVQELQERTERFQKRHETVFARPVGGGQAARWVNLAQAHRPAHRAKAVAEHR